LKNYPHLFARLFNAPLLMHPSKLHAIVSGLAGRFGLDPPEPGLYITPSGTASKGGYRVIDGVGVIDIFGVLAHRTTMAADSSYIQGYDGIARRLDAALADRAVDSIVLNIDSPGGEVSGAFQLAEHIRSARSVKPIHAVANELAASAGYLIASAAQTLSLPETAEIGSIGVVICHVDMSGAFAKQGVKVTPIFAGSHKVDGNPYAPLPDEVAQRLQADINHYYSLFMDAVAESRPNLSRDAIRKTEAALFIGQSAIKVGLADRLETADQLISRLASEHRKSTSRSYPAPRAAQSESKKMTDEITEAPAAPAYLSAADVASLCIGAGETALGRSLVGGQHTAESVAKRLADAREIRKMATLNRMPEEAERLIVAGLTPEQAGPLLVTESAHRTDQLIINSAVGVDVVGESRERFRTGMSAALAIRSGLQPDDPQNEFRGLTLVEMARASLQQAGVVGLPGDKRTVVGMSITHGSSDFPYLLQSTAERSLVRGYTEMPETFEAWTNEGSVSDFKPISRASISEFSPLLEVKENGEYKYGTFNSAAESMQIATYGRMFSISRQAIINDDLRAFADTPRKMGKAARRLIGDLAYMILTSNPVMSDGVTLFHAATHKNLANPASALSLASIGALRTAMALQTDPTTPDPRALGIRPRYLVVPVGMEDAARALLESQYNPEATNKLQAPNPARNWNLVVVSDPRLDASSGTAFYLIADPSIYDTVEVAYLDGNKTPYLEQKQGWSVDGVEYKVRIDVGAKAIDWRTLAKNAGV
jgi:signal peptide peptidase SppA